MTKTWEGDEIMNPIRRSTVYRLAASAHEAGLDVMNGAVQRDENGRWQVGDQDLESWLVAHEGQEITMVLGSLEDDRPIEVRTCRTCGRDYQDIECPYCRANRIRLRGHA